MLSAEPPRQSDLMRPPNMWYHLIDISLQLSKNKWCCSLPPIPRSQKTGFGRTGRTNRIQPTGLASLRSARLRLMRIVGRQCARQVF